MSFISDAKRELNDLFQEKDEANKEMKLIKRLADKKILCSFIFAVFLIVTMLLNMISNSIDGIFMKLAGIELKGNILTKLLLPNLSYSLLYVFGYSITGLALVKVIFNFKASFKDIKEGQKGTSRFTERYEIREQYKCVNEVESEEERLAGGYEGKGGVIIARDGDKFFIDDSPTNNLIIGTTRSGKGELFVFPSIDLYSRAKEKASLVVNDPKAELYSASKEILEQRGYRVELLNLIVPTNSMSYNPLQLIINAYDKGEYSTAQSLCKTLTHMLYYKPNVKDPFWQNSAMSLVNALILAVIEKCFENKKIIDELKEQIELKKLLEDLNNVDISTLDEEKLKKLDEERLKLNNKIKRKESIEEIKVEINKLKEEMENEKPKVTLYTVANMLSELGSKTDIKGNNELDKYFEKLEAKSVAKMQYATSNFSKGEARGSIFSVAMSELNIFTMDEIAKLTARNSLNLKDIGFKSEDNRPVAVFMAVPDFDSSNHVIASIFVRQLYYVLAKEATFNVPAKCDREVIFLLDEFGNMPAIEGMANIVTVCLGRNIKFNLVIQAISQLKKLYGDDYKTIMGNCSNKFYIFTNEVETAEEFSKLLGDKTIVTYSRSGEILDTTKHQTESVDSRRLLNTDELMHLKEGEIVIARGTKRRDLQNRKIRPYPIFNTAEHTLKYRYEYLGAFFDNQKNLINEKVETLHNKINLEDLILFRSDDGNKSKVANETKELVKDQTKGKTQDKNNMDGSNVKLIELFSNKEIDDINYKIEVLNKDIELNSQSTWKEFYEIVKVTDNEDLKKYKDIGVKELEKKKSKWEVIA